MIVFDLECKPNGHRFEAWFLSSDDYDKQQNLGLLCCPHCGSSKLVKAVMAPNLGRKGNQLRESLSEKPSSAPAPSPSPSPSSDLHLSAVRGGSSPLDVAQALKKLAEIQAAALSQSRWVGDDFAEQARKIHYGEWQQELIHGQVNPDEATALLDEGIEIVPLLLPFTPPKELN